MRSITRPSYDSPDDTEEVSTFAERPWLVRFISVVVILTSVGAYVGVWAWVFGRVAVWAGVLGWWPGFVATVALSVSAVFALVALVGVKTWSQT